MRNLRQATNQKRKPVNLSLRQDLVEQAKSLNVNVSHVAEQALEEEVRRAKEAAWLKENADAIKEYNERVDRRGVYIEDLRQF